VKQNNCSVFHIVTALLFASQLGLAAYFLESVSDSRGREDLSPCRVRVRKDVVAAVIERLEVLLRWMKGQNR
jgi:hypothetical protein